MGACSSYSTMSVLVAAILNLAAIFAFGVVINRFYTLYNYFIDYRPREIISINMDLSYFFWRVQLLGCFGAYGGV